MGIPKKLFAGTAVALSLAVSALTTTKASALDIVFINDGHVAPYHVNWLNGFEDAIAAYNKEFGDVTGRWLSAEANLEKMIQQAEATINEKPDIMFVNAISTEAFEPLVAKAQAAGITWIAVHSPMDSADYSFTLGDVVNGRNQGMAMCALSGGKPYKVGIMLGAAGNPSGEARRQGILEGVSTCDHVEVVSEQPADWNVPKAQDIAENWLTQFPDLDAISGVTDAYIIGSIPIVQNAGRSVDFYGYDGEIPVLQQMGNGPVKADILLSGTREGWNFVQMAYRISKGETLDKVYDFYTPLVLTEADHKTALANGFPSDVEVYYVDKALEVAEKGYLEYGPDSVK